MGNAYVLAVSHSLMNSYLSWLDGSANLFVASCYFSIGMLIALELWRNRDQGVDLMMTSATGIFFSCALGQIAAGAGMLGLENQLIWQTGFNLVMAVPALTFLSFHNKYGLFVQFNKIIKSKAELEKRNALLEQIVEQRTQELSQQNQRLKEAVTDLHRMQMYLIQTEKMSMLGQMIAGISHEINNPINCIYNNLPYLEEHVQDLLKVLHLYEPDDFSDNIALPVVLEEVDLDFVLEDLPRIMNSMHLGVNRIRELVVSLRNFYRLDEAQMKPADLHAGIESTLVLLHNRYQGKIEILRDFGDIPPVECHINQLNQVFMNLISNAIDSLLEIEAEKKALIHKEIVITTQRLGNDRVAVRISDNGSGITPEVQERLFEPFFTTKPMGIGTGLGLSICDQIVRDNHHGAIYCCSAPSAGTTFSVELLISQTLVTVPAMEVLPAVEV